MVFIRLYQILFLSLFLCSPAWATVNVVRFPSGTPVQVCQPSDTNTNCGGGGSSGLTIGTTPIANGTNGYVEYNNNGVLGEKAASGTGTVTSVAALTLGTTGTDLSSTVANSTTTPVITLQVPTASASNRGALSSTDWSTFNGKQASLSVLKGTLTDGDLCTYTASGTLLSCNTAASGLSVSSASTATTATNATNVATTTKSDATTYYPTFVGANSSANQGVNVGAMTYNPSTATLTVTNFAGNASTATSATSATTATNLASTSQCSAGQGATGISTSGAAQGCVTYLQNVGIGTANTIPYWDSTSTIGSLNTGTYPSLTELSYSKGVTSAIQTQINGKQASGSYLTNVGIGTANTISYWNSTSTIGSLNTSTYPSLTELAYVKGVTSAIQTQIGNKANTASPTFTGTVTAPNIGVGTLTASAGLTVVGNVGIGTTANQTALSVMSGNVGIGTWAPTYPLQVLGNFQAYQPVVTVTAGATPTIVAANGVDYEITGLATAITSMSTNLSGTTTNGAIIEIDITDNATPQGLTFGTSFESTTVTLPTTTVASTRLRLFFQYNSTSGKWSLIGMA